MKQCVARLLQHARLMVGNLVDLEFVYIPSGMSGDKDDPRNDVAYIGWKYMGWDHPSKRKIPTKTHDNKASKLFHDTWEGMRA